MEDMDDRYYVEFIDYHNDGCGKIVIVPRDLFERLLPHAGDLAMGTVHSQPLFNEAYGHPDADLRPSEARAIPGSRRIEIAIC